MKSALVACVLALPAHASSILLAGDSNIFTTSADNEVFFQNVFNGQRVANFSYNSLSGLGTTAVETSYGSGGTINATNLAGADFMIFGYSRNSVSASDIAAITDFYNGGGSLFLFGEGNTGFSALNTAVNSILSAVGSTMSLSLDAADNFDIGGFTTFSVTGATAFATGVDSWTTAYAAGINIGSGTAVISGTADAGFGTAVAYESAMAPPLPPIPVPAGLPLMVTALAGLGLVRRRRRGA